MAYNMSTALSGSKETNMRWFINDPEEGELSDEELDDVSGGGNYPPPPGE
jgi:hypothetical protein